MESVNKLQGPVGKDILSVKRKVGLVGQSAALEQILRTIEQVAATDISVLIIGESGTGKELVAEAIHEASQRSANPFVVVNAGAIPEGIIESELFGHEKGAFTGAVGTRKGYFESANGGTILLDEIGEMPLEAQVRLLRVLEGREFIRVGSSTARKVDVRVIAATNKDLFEAVAANEFRQDLYYRLNAVKIVVPPLRERKVDIPLLVDYFAEHFCEQNRISFDGFADSALQIFAEYQWPGNIRELKNAVESLIVIGRGMQIDASMVRRNLHNVPPEINFNRQLPVPLNRSSEELEREFLYRALLDIKSEIAQLREVILGGYIMPNRRLVSRVPMEPTNYDIIPNDERRMDDQLDVSFPTLEEIEKNHIYHALEKSGGNKRKAAAMLEISERTLYRKIKEYNLPF
ncbi:MAG: sigma-54-dependent Fis family transcriptional regulator [Deferribacteres bacterium]|nr:sigma-54-dependent Fis family transcriptional regulator [candidate division KSB1 bacterium]MCB9509466.1 sigma-54-dependent Fis family transcriptional regulator [Deferribacteres bacterium]